MIRQKEQWEDWLGRKNKGGDRKRESNDSPEIPDRRNTSDIPSAHLRLSMSFPLSRPRLWHQYFSLIPCFGISQVPYLEIKPKVRNMWHSEARNQWKVWRRTFDRKRKDFLQSFLTQWQFPHEIPSYAFKPSLPRHISILFCSRQWRRHLDTHPILILIIMISKNGWFLGDLSQVVFSRALASKVGVKDGTLTTSLKGCNSGASQKISWEQLATCSAHSKEHFTTSLADTGGGWVGAW